MVATETESLAVSNLVVCILLECFLAPDVVALHVSFIFRNFLKSKWGMEEFMIADAEAVGGRKNFIIIVLKDKLKMKDLVPELRTYMRTYTLHRRNKEYRQIG